MSTWKLSLLLVLLFSSPRAAQASARCSNLFLNSTELQSTLPLEFRERLQQNASERAIRQFEKRFNKRERISAEREAERLTSLLLLDAKETSLKLLPLSRRHASISEVLHARLQHESTRVRLENILLEIGYDSGSPRSKAWRDFRERHTQSLEIAKVTAINAATTIVLGLPLYLKPIRFQTFRPNGYERAVWPQVEIVLRERIHARDTSFLRDIKIEIAIELTRRLIAVAVLGIVADEFLTFMYPEWGLIKASTLGRISTEDRESLETKAFENWKDIVEAFTDQRPSDDSKEALEIRERLKKLSQNELWLHVYEGGPL
ncbi:MAG: hypothetical protein RBT63_05245 [Bdellovibrionales bacterium]|jgi:hypothetical protein|nr:hypothetical protein [Bdellovibrionales bacterium]